VTLPTDPHSTPGTVAQVVARSVGAATGLALRLAPRASVRLFGMLEARRPQSSLALLDRLVRPGDVVIDVGAHRGVYTDRLARLVGPLGHVYAFEPNPDSWRVLQAVKGAASNVTIQPIGISDHAGSATLYRPRRRGLRVDAMSTLSAQRDRSEVSFDPVSVQLDRLDVVLEAERRRIALIKIDVEGHELAVLRGSESILQSSRPTILIEIEQRHQDADIRNTFDYIAGLGYSGSFLSPDGLRPLEAFDVRRHQTDLLPNGFAVGRPAPGYVSDFLFIPVAGPSHDVRPTATAG
jgi:FkbM family methyltransferase